MSNTWMGGALTLLAVATIGAAGCGGTGSKAVAASPASIARAAAITVRGGGAVTNDRIAAYRDFIRAEAALVTANFGAEGITCGAADFAGCRAAALTARDASQRFLDYVATVALPASIAQSEARLRHALSVCINGSSLQIKGIDEIDGAEISAGSAQVGEGTTLLSSVTASLASP